MGKSSRIRPLVLGLIFKDDRLLVAEGYDPVKQQTFYRALGGGVDFNESSLAALQREFQEEIQAELTNIQYLGFVESIFTYEGKPGHEWIQFYRCEFADAQFYQKAEIPCIEGKLKFIASWVDCDRFRSGELKLVPEACLQFL
jgi:NADH pyrophosphatase NudC (nudix superfamily)